MKLRIFFTSCLLLICSLSFAQTWSNIGVSSWQRQPTAKGYFYRANIAPNAPGFFYLYTSAQIDSLIAAGVGAGVTSFNGRTGTVVPIAGDYGSLTQTLTNKTISGASNTLTNIANASLTNSSITIQGTAVSLGGSINPINGTGFVKATGTTVSYDNSVYITASSTNTLTNKNLTSGTNTFPTFNQNTTGSAGSVGHTLTNGYGIVSLGYNGSTNTSIVADTTSSTALVGKPRLTALNSTLLHNVGNESSSGNKTNSGAWSFSQVTVPKLFTGNLNLSGVSLVGFYNSNANGNMLIGNNRSGSLGEIDFLNAVGTAGSAVGGFNWSNVTTAGTVVPLLDINGSTKDITTFGRLFVGSIPSSSSVANDYVTIDPISAVLVRRTAAQVLIDATNNRQGQVALSSGVATVTLTGITTSSHAFITLASALGTLTTTWQYQAVCTANTLTITALTNSATTNTADASLINYLVIQ